MKLANVDKEVKNLQNNKCQNLYRTCYWHTGRLHNNVVNCPNDPSFTAL